MYHLAWLMHRLLNRLTSFSTKMVLSKQSLISSKVMIEKPSKTSSLHPIVRKKITHGLVQLPSLTASIGIAHGIDQYNRPREWVIGLSIKPDTLMIRNDWDLDLVYDIMSRTYSNHNNRISKLKRSSPFYLTLASLTHYNINDLVHDKIHFTHDPLPNHFSVQNYHPEHDKLTWTETLATHMVKPDTKDDSGSIYSRSFHSQHLLAATAKTISFCAPTGGRGLIDKIWSSYQTK